MAGFRDQLVAASLKGEHGREELCGDNRFRDQLVAASLKGELALFLEPLLARFRDQLVAASLKDIEPAAIRGEHLVSATNWSRPH